jgi:hypothetical protein
MVIPSLVLSFSHFTDLLNLESCLNFVALSLSLSFSLSLSLSLSLRRFSKDDPTTLKILRFFVLYFSNTFLDGYFCMLLCTTRSKWVFKSKSAAQDGHCMLQWPVIHRIVYTVMLGAQVSCSTGFLTIRAFNHLYEAMHGKIAISTFFLTYDPKWVTAALKLVSFKWER